MRILVARAQRQCQYNPLYEHISGGPKIQVKGFFPLILFDDFVASEVIITFFDSFYAFSVKFYLFISLEWNFFWTKEFMLDEFDKFVKISVFDSNLTLIIVCLAAGSNKFNWNVAYYTTQAEIVHDHKHTTQ